MKTDIRWYAKSCGLVFVSIDDKPSIIFKRVHATKEWLRVTTLSLFLAARFLFLAVLFFLTKCPHFPRRFFGFSLGLTCEVNTVPPNESSMRFHERYGFRTVGTQTLEDGCKKVALMAKERN